MKAFAFFSLDTDSKFMLVFIIPKVFFFFFFFLWRVLQAGEGKDVLEHTGSQVPDLWETVGCLSSCFKLYLFQIGLG